MGRFGLFLTQNELTVPTLKGQCLRDNKLALAPTTDRFSRRRLRGRRTVYSFSVEAIGGASHEKFQGPRSKNASECHSSDLPSASGQRSPQISSAVLLGVGAVACSALLPAVAHAAEAAPPGFLEFVLFTVESLGPFGPVAFVFAVMFFECIPLFPTQPLSLASGILFGASQGAACMLTGTTAAAVIAFLIARGVGRPLAERIIKAEMAEEGSGPSSKLQAVVEAIERGSFWQQAGAILVLRLTPVVPFSASNYVLGLSPLPLAPYLAGTLGGMAFWSVLYASLGSASRTLLDFKNGANADALLADVLERAGGFTEATTAVIAVIGGVAGLAFFLNSRLQADKGAPSVDPPTGILTDLGLNNEVMEQAKD